MNLWESLCSAVERVAGNAATVMLEFDPPSVFPGQEVQVRVTVTNGSAPLEVRGILLDLEAHETITLRNYKSLDLALGEIAASFTGQMRVAPSPPVDVNHETRTFSAPVRVAQRVVLAPNEVRRLHGYFKLPPDARPTYQGTHARHDWRVRARLEILGTDPDSGWHRLRVGART